MYLSMIAALALGAGADSAPDVGPFVRALWLVQRCGTAEAADPANDSRIKALLFKAMGKDGELALEKSAELLDAGTFQQLAGADHRLGAAEIRSAVEAAVPESRKRLLSKVREYADSLTTSFDMIDERHREAGRTLADWIARNYQPGRKLHVTAVCTANSRRSYLCETLGNIAAAYYGLPEVTFHSGGTAASAFNPRTVAALAGIGVEIAPTGEEAERGEPQTKNPIYRVRWGTSGGLDGAAMECLEFSKKYHDPANPQQGFVALMVCGEADEACPVVTGAVVRISMPYLDPKIYDGSAFETAKYAERRDDMGRLMLATMMQARHRLRATPVQPEK
jgi:arsenate reductase